MAFSEDRFTLGMTCASQLAPYNLVTLSAGKESQVEQLLNASQRPYGAVLATVATAGAGAAVYEDPSIVKMVAAASVGVGAEVAIASIGVASIVQQQGVATITMLAPKSVAASGTVQWAAGLAMTNAQAGQIFSVKLAPRQVSGLA